MSLNPPTDSRSNPDSRPVYTLEDLRSWDKAGVWLAVVGYPVKHSISPAMHNAALQVIMQRFPEYATWRYTRFEIPHEAFAEALPLFREKGFYGLNLTLPHKIQVLDLIQDIDPEAVSMGAVNTLVLTDRGYRGFNTDGWGLRTGIYTDLGQRLADSDIVLLGAGGAARAAAFQCLKDGCRSLWIGNRSQGRLDSLLQAIGNDERVRSFLFKSPPEDLPEKALIIQATSSGLKPEDSLPLDLNSFSNEAALYDMIYNPRVTRLMKIGMQRGMRVANGLSMLIQQGARSLEIWTQVPVTVTAMEAAARAELNMGG